MISNYSVKKPFTIFVAVILIIILGFISFTNMTTDLLPKMDLPYALIVTTYVGASPEKVENVVTKPIEQSMATVSNVKNITSVSSENSSMVILEFSSDVNMDSALIELNGKLDLIKAAWDDSSIGAPIVSKINPNMLPVMMTAVDVGEMDNAEIKSFVNNNILPELERIDGVASVTTTGMIEEQIQIKLNQEKIDGINKKLVDSVNSKLSKAEGELNKAKTELEKGKQELSKQQKEQMSKIDDGMASIETGLATISKKESEIASKEEGLKLTKTTLTKTIGGMDTLLNKMNSEKAELVKLGNALTQEQKVKLEVLNNSISKTEKLKEETTKQLTEIETGLDQISVGKTQIATQKSNLQEKQKQLEVAKSTLTIELSKASSKLEQGEEELNKGIKEFETARDEALKNASIDGIITQEMVSNILMANNFSMPAGYIENQNDKMLIKVGEKFASLEEIQNLTICSFDIEGLKNVTLGDLADISYTDNSDEVYAKVNGNNAIVLSFQKQSTSSTADVCKTIQSTMKKLENENVRFTTLMNQGVYIDLIIGTVLENLLYGAILAVIILFIFLKDYRPTIIIALSIPISLTFAIALMYFTGVTINIISLSGLALGVGMLVDNSIVVIENIYRLRKEGSSVKEAAIQGASRVAGAIASSTLTTVCVFLPIVFIEGISRQLFTDMGLTIAYSLLASLIVALTLVPAMASKMFKNTKPKETKLFDKFTNIYEKTLKVALNHKIIVVTLCLVLLVTSAVLASRMGTAFIPEVDGTQISITITPPKDTIAKDAQNKANEMIDKLLENIDEIETIGAIDSSAMGTMSSGSSSSITMYAILKEDKKLSNKEIANKIYELTSDSDYEISVKTSNMDMSSMMSSGIQVVIKGKETDKLQEIAKEVTTMLEQVEGIGEVDSGISETQKEQRVTVDKNKAMEYGLTVAQVYQKIAAEVTNEKEATEVTIDNKDYPVVVVKQEEKKTMTDNLASIVLSGKKNNETVEVKLSEIATIEEADGLASISHDNQERYISVSATIKTDSNVGLVGREVENKLKEYKAPEGYSVELQGESETINQSLTDLATMILLAVVFIYLIMVAQFQSLKSPFIVMFTIPLAFTGGLFALWMTGCEISLIAMLGFLMLAGIVVNNGIVFIDYANQLRSEKGMNVRDALLETGKTRLKPILMTALTTILGLSTMAIGMGMGAEMIQPLGIVTIGGLVYSTILTLYLVPALYMMMNKDKKPKAEKEKKKNK
ncbi:MAG: efflux RND transporter permease subunit [Clostridia bacterium]|nr:efflux RND transporter permease subunit [Clostridia bacterium]